MDTSSWGIMGWQTIVFIPTLIVKKMLFTQGVWGYYILCKICLLQYTDTNCHWLLDCMTTAVILS